MEEIARGGQRYPQQGGGNYPEQGQGSSGRVEYPRPATALMTAANLYRVSVPDNWRAFNGSTVLCDVCPEARTISRSAAATLRTA